MADKTVTVKPSGQGGDYITLSLAIAGEHTANPDLVAMGGILHIAISGTWSSAETATVSIPAASFTVDSTHYIDIYTDTANRPASTGWDATKYRLISSSGYGINCTLAFTRFKGLQVSPGNDSSYRAAIYCAGASVTIADCYLKSPASPPTGLWGIEIDTSTAGTNNIYNNIITGFTGTSSMGINFNINNTPVNKVFNNTIFNCDTGVTGAGSNTTLKNNAIFDCTDDIGGTVTADYNAIDDADTQTHGQQFTAGSTDWNKVFTDYTTGNVKLLNYSTPPCCVGTGVDDPGSGLYSDDIDANARSSPWDIGANEYVAAGAGVSIPVRAID